MPSTSLQWWKNDRIPRLSDIDNQCAACSALTPPQPKLLEENLRGYVLLLSAHFQGFCRDLYTECAQIVVSKVRAALQGLIQRQFTEHCKLDHGNPNLQNIRGDFERFGFSLDLPAADPANTIRLADLADLNKWRNVAAHDATIPAHFPALTLPAVQSWQNSCDKLGESLDGIMYNQMKGILKRKPW